MTRSWVDEAELTVAPAGTLLTPVKVTEFEAAVALKFVPVIVTVEPRSPDVGFRLEIVGIVAVAVDVLDGGEPSPTGASGSGSATSTIANALVAAPPSGFVTVTTRGASSASRATSTFTEIVEESVNWTEL